MTSYQRMIVTAFPEVKPDNHFVVSYLDKSFVLRNIKNIAKVSTGIVSNISGIAYIEFIAMSYIKDIIDHPETYGVAVVIYNTSISCAVYSYSNTSGIGLRTTMPFSQLASRLQIIKGMMDEYELNSQRS